MIDNKQKFQLIGIFLLLQQNLIVQLVHLVIKFVHLFFDVETIENLLVLVVLQQLSDVTRVIIVVDVVVVKVAKGSDGLGDVRIIATGARKLDVALDEHFILVTVKNRKSIFSKSQLGILLILQADLADREEEVFCDGHVVIVESSHERGDDRRFDVVFEERVCDRLHVRTIPLCEAHDDVFVGGHNRLVSDVFDLTVVQLGDLRNAVIEHGCDVVFVWDVLEQGVHDEGGQADDATLVLLLDTIHHHEAVAEHLDRAKALLFFCAVRVPPRRVLVEGRRRDPHDALLEVRVVAIKRHGVVWLFVGVFNVLDVFEREAVLEHGLSDLFGHDAFSSSSALNFSIATLLAFSNQEDILNR